MRKNDGKKKVCVEYGGCEVWRSSDACVRSMSDLLVAARPSQHRLIRRFPVISDGLDPLRHPSTGSYDTFPCYQMGWTHTAILAPAHI